MKFRFYLFTGNEGKAVQFLPIVKSIHMQLKNTNICIELANVLGHPEEKIAFHKELIME
jgi:surfactin synthase thioesterase subunit